MLLTAVLIPSPEGGFTALNPETGTTSQGESIDEALANLREATELYLGRISLEVVGPVGGHDVSSGNECLACRGFLAHRPLSP